MTARLSPRQRDVLLGVRDGRVRDAKPYGWSWRLLDGDSGSSTPVTSTVDSLLRHGLVALPPLRSAAVGAVRLSDGGKALALTGRGSHIAAELTETTTAVTP